MRAILLRLAALVSRKRPVPDMKDGRLYRFRTFWEGGAAYRFDAPDRLTSLSYPNEDLAVTPDGRVIVPDSGDEFGHVRDLVELEL